MRTRARDTAESPARPDVPGGRSATPWAGRSTVVAVFAATYFAVGDLSTVHDRATADFVLHPASWEPGRNVPVALAAAVLAFAAAALVARDTRRGRRRSSPALATLLLSLVAAYAALLYRQATAAVIGANIGYGVLMILGGPTALALTGFAAFLLLRKPPRRRSH